MNGNLRQWNDIIKVFVFNYEEMAQEYGGTPTWTVTRTDSNPDALDYEWHTDDYFGIDGRAVGTLNSMPTGPMSAELTVACEWGGQTASKIIRINAVQPVFSFPDGLDNLPNVIDLEVGDTLTLAPTLVPAGWNGNGYEPSLFVANGLTEFADWLKGSADVTTIRETGVFQDTVGLMVGTILVSKPVTFRVGSANPVLTLRTNGTGHINRYLGMTRKIEEETGVFSLNALADAEIDRALYLQMQSVYGGESTWKVEQTAGTQKLPFTWSVEKMDDGAERADVRLEAQDLVDQKIQPETAEITITCEWGGQTAAVVTEVEIKYPPNGLPNGIDYNNGSDTVVCRVSDTLSVTPSILPGTWGGIPGYPSVYAGNSGEFEAFCTENSRGDWGRKLTVTRTGVYQCFVGVGTDTITAGKWITYYATNRDGTLPADQYTPIGNILKLPDKLTEIGSEAFAGTVFTEIDIPKGVKTIAEDAFDGSSVVAIYTHGNPVANEYARKHGLIGVTDQ